MPHFDDSLRYWKSAIKKFLKARPELVISNTRGYFRMLEHIGVLPTETADKLCQYDARQALLRPETFVRIRRELLERHEIHIAPEQKALLEKEDDRTREYYRG